MPTTPLIGNSIRSDCIGENPNSRPVRIDAITLAPPEARRLLRAGGFEILRTDFLFIFPGFLSPLRKLEPAFAALPLGAQYLVLARKS